MFPALTFVARRQVSRRLIAAGGGGAMLALALIANLLGSGASTSNAGRQQELVERLAPSTWAIAVPTAWLATSVAEVRTGQSVDLIAVRGGDRPLAIPIAADLRVMGVAETAVVFQVDEDAATAIATARASGLLIVPLIRSAR
jgi:hypothetical protein